MVFHRSAARVLTMFDYDAIRILLAEDNPGDVRLLEEYLKAGESGIPFHLCQTGTLAGALELLDNADFEVVLLDLSLPDSQGMETFFRVNGHPSEVPVIVFSGLCDEQVAIEAVRGGAQDYLVKGSVDGPLLRRSIQYAIERHRLQTILRRFALTDPLTGLFNRRGFMLLAEQQLALANRNKKGVCLLFGDLDGLKEINDQFGHSAGDEALNVTAKILKKTFRLTDVIARIGGDEFVILAPGLSPEYCGQVNNPLSRFRNELHAYNQNSDLGFDIVLSFGTAGYAPEAPCTIEELLEQADARMYGEKGRKMSRT